MWMTCSRLRCQGYSAPENQPASEVWNWRSSKARSQVLRLVGVLSRQNGCSGNAGIYASSRIPSTEPLRCDRNCRNLPRPETMVCRCEDVSYSRVALHQSWRTAKLQSRCGMGPCQGRVCGPITRFLFGWSPDSVRPPIFPTRFESLAAMACQVQPEHSPVTGEHA